jgi:hypothetical protein
MSDRDAPARRSWVCPAHFCVRCAAYSTDNGQPHLDLGSLPLSVAASGLSVKQSPLSSCAKCPLSICRECESDVGGGVPVVLLTSPELMRSRARMSPSAARDAGMQRAGEALFRKTCEVNALSGGDRDEASARLLADRVQCVELLWAADQGQADGGEGAARINRTLPQRSSSGGDGPADQVSPLL